MGRQYDDPLEFLLDGAAEQYGGCKDLTPSSALRNSWARWGDYVDQALGMWLKENPSALTDPEVSPLDDDELAYIVFQTLSGAGVGIWDGRWDHYFGGLKAGHSTPKHTKQALESLQKRLKTTLDKDFAVIENDINNEAYDQCRKHGSDEVSEDQGSPALFTWAALEKKNLSGLGAHPRGVGSTPRSAPMRLNYFPMNQRWFFTMGTSIIELHDEPRSFATKLEATAAAHRRGLRIDAQNRVHPRNPSNMEGV